MYHKLKLKADTRCSQAFKHENVVKIVWMFEDVNAFSERGWGIIKSLLRTLELLRAYFPQQNVRRGTGLRPQRSAETRGRYEPRFTGVLSVKYFD